MPRRAFPEYLAESLAQIERHVPQLYALVARHLGRRTVRIQVSGEVLSLCVEGGRIAFDPGRQAGDLEATTTRAAIVALADGQATLEQAVMDERVRLYGSVEDLEAGMDALSAYLNGAARCPELLGLMDTFRADAQSGGMP